MSSFDSSSFWIQIKTIVSLHFPHYEAVDAQSQCLSEEPFRLAAPIVGTFCSW